MIVRYFHLDKVLSNIMEILIVSFIFLAIMRSCNCYCYSNMNAAWVLYVWYFEKKHLIPFIICNHTGTIFAWYSSWLLDRSIPSRMMSKYEWPWYQFMFGDIVLHILPSFFVYKSIQTNFPIENTSRFSGLYSVLIYLLWGLSLEKPFDVSDLYVPLSFWTVNFLWTVSIFIHIITMNILHMYIA